MAQEREVKVTVLGDSSRGQRSLAELDDSAKRTESHFDGLGSKLASFGKVAAIGLAGAAVGVGAFLKSSVEAAEESRQVAAQTEAVIKSTGGAAGITAEHVNKLSDSLAGLTGIDDEVIGAGENVLMTFTNLRNEAGKGNDVFDRATKSALDMSVALHQDLQSSSIMVGKALQDPIKGVTALSKAGANFSPVQREMIKNLVEAGDVMGAQKIILKELEGEFGGSAEAAASPMARLKVVVGNLQEALGARLLPVVGKVAGILATVLPKALDAAGQAWAFLTAGFKDPAAMQGPRNFLDVLFNLGAIASKVWTEITGGLRAFAASWKAFDGDVTSAGFPGFMEKAAFAIRSALEAVVDWVKKHWPEIKKIITDTLKSVQSVVKGVVDVLVTIWENFGDQIVDVAKAAWRFVRDTIEGALRVIQGIVKVITSLIHGDWAGVWEGIKEIVSGAWEIIKARIDLALNIIKNLISVALEIITAAWSGAWNGIKDFFAGIWDAIFGFARAGVANIVDAFLGMAGLVIHAAETAFGWIPGIGGKLHEAADKFDEFRDNVNNSLRGIQDRQVLVEITTRFYEEVHPTAQVGLGYTGGDNASGVYALGMEKGPIPGTGPKPIIAHGGEWVVTPEQMARLRGGTGSPATWAGGAAGGDGSGSIVLGPGAIVVYALDPKGAALAVRDELIGYSKRVPTLGLT